MVVKGETLKAWQVRTGGEQWETEGWLCDYWHDENWDEKQVILLFLWNFGKDAELKLKNITWYHGVMDSRIGLKLK